MQPNIFTLNYDFALVNKLATFCFIVCQKTGSLRNLQGIQKNQFPAQHLDFLEREILQRNSIGAIQRQYHDFVGSGSF